MKKSMTEYLINMSNKKLEKLENIIENHYKNFVDTYKILKDYSDSINKIKSKELSDDRLEIKVFCKKGTGDDILSNISDNFSDDISIDDDVITFKIDKDE